MVQFAEHQINKVDYAMKFIVTRRTFVEESAQYTDPDNPLLRFLPQVSPPPLPRSPCPHPCPPPHTQPHE